MPLPPSALVKGKATGRARLGLQPGLVPSFGFTPCSRPRPAWHTRARCFTLHACWVAPNDAAGVGPQSSRDG